jgi:hypothetical protein
MKRTLILILFAIISLTAKAQQYTYSPLSDDDMVRIGRLLLQNKLNSILNNTYIRLGVVDLGPCENFLHYNPIESVRLRISGKTNEKLSKNLTFEWLLAYGIGDKKFKYGAGFTYKLTKKSRITLSYYDNTYMPYLSSYDKIQYSLFDNSNFILASKRTGTIKYLYSLTKHLTLTPAIHYHNYYSRLHYADKQIYEQIINPIEYLTGEIKMSWQPKATTLLSLTLSHNYPLSNSERKYNQIKAIAQHRLVINSLFYIDARAEAGKIFGNTNPYLYLTPYMTNGYVSSTYGFNLLPYSSNIYHTQYAQTWAQINLKIRKLNAFAYHKALFGNEFYQEIGIGVDRLYNSFGVEVITCLPYKMWGIRLRVN